MKYILVCIDLELKLSDQFKNIKYRVPPQKGTAIIINSKIVYLTTPNADSTNSKMSKCLLVISDFDI